jgi:hypothetical protein
MEIITRRLYVEHDGINRRKQTKSIARVEGLGMTQHYFYEITILSFLKE